MRASTTGRDGELYGSLAPGWPNGVGTQLLLRGWTAQEVEGLAPWFGPRRNAVPTLWPFCRTGADGSIAALWSAPDGQTHVVHLGSGSGSMLTCVLGERPVDFLRLIAIGYDEICWNQDWNAAPASVDGRPTVNVPFRTWVETTFSTTIPNRGTDVVAAPAELGDDSDDPWCRWVDNATRDDGV